MEVLDREDMIFASVDSEVDAAVDTNQLRDREIERLTEETHEITEDVREDARAKLGMRQREHRAKVRRGRTLGRDYLLQNAEKTLQHA